MKLKWLAVGVTALSAASVFAAEFREYPDLPSQQVVQQALQNYPSVLAAQAGVRASEAMRERLEAGEHEFNLNAGTARRRIRDSSETPRDWSVGLERALRLPRKAELDDALGQQQVVLAHNTHGDAMHEAGRKLLAGWFSWLREHAQNEQWQQQVNILRQQLDVVVRRVKAGDAARLEEDLAQAALMQAEISLQQARLRMENAATALVRHFPLVSLPQSPVLAEPQPLQEEFAYWLDLGLDHNHELLLARAGAKIAQLTARRTDADKIPDPSLGLHYISERDGSERLTGLSVSIPLPGAVRRAASAESSARAEMAAQQEALVLRRLEAEISASHNTAKSAYASWQSAKVASELMGRNEGKIARAYALGEMNLNDLLLARRQGMEARLAASLARLDAAESRYRLLLDTHQLWPLGRDESEGHH